MPLILATDTNPGDADWIDASIIGGGGDSPLLVVDVVGDTAPPVDPTGRRNIVYMGDEDPGRVITATLPEITPSLPPTWRMTVQDAEFLHVLPGGSDTFANWAVFPYVRIQGGSLAVGGGSTVTFVHDTVSRWGVFSCCTYGNPV